MLTIIGPLVPYTSRRRLSFKQSQRSATFGVQKEVDTFTAPGLYLLLYRRQQGRNSYSEKNFGRNQLPDSSMSLSPLYIAHWINLRVRIHYNLLRDFSRFRCDHAKFTIFRVMSTELQAQHFLHKCVQIG